MNSESSSHDNPSEEEDESVVSLTEFLDRLERRAFARSLEDRHPMDKPFGKGADCENE
jgi:hypothetical protein